MRDNQLKMKKAGQKPCLTRERREGRCLLYRFLGLSLIRFFLFLGRRRRLGDFRAGPLVLRGSLSRGYAGKGR